MRSWPSRSIPVFSRPSFTRFVVRIRNLRKTRRSESSSLSIAGLSLKQQINYAALKDGTELTVTVTNMSGAALKGLTIGDVYKNTWDLMKEEGETVSEPKDFEIAGRKGKEVTHTTKDGVEGRLVLLVVKGRTYELSVAAKDKAKLNAFLQAQASRYGSQDKEGAKRQALTDLCHMLLSANEFAYVD